MVLVSNYRLQLQKLSIGHLIRHPHEHAPITCQIGLHHKHQLTSVRPMSSVYCISIKIPPNQHMLMLRWELIFKGFHQTVHSCALYGNSHRKTYGLLTKHDY